MSFAEQPLLQINANPWKILSDDWALLSAGTLPSWNTMTVSWGGVGVLWNKNILTVYVRPTRYTYGFMEANEHFTLSFLDMDIPQSRKALEVCGSVSGKNSDKAKEADLKPVEIMPGAVIFESSRLAFVCRKIYFQDITPDHFCDSSIEKNYPDKDYHRAYIGEIIKVFQKQ